MRTTITLDDDVITKVKQYMRQSGKSARIAFNELLRNALSQTPQKKHKTKAAELPVFKGKGGLMPGFSWELSTAQTLDKLDEEDWKHAS